MKITRSQLRQIIINEVSSYQTSKYDQASSNTKIVAELIMSGMATLSGEDFSPENKYEYGENVLTVIGKYMEPQGINALADIFMEMRSENPDVNGDGSLDADELRTIASDLDEEEYPKHLGYTDPKTGQKIMKQLQSSEEMDRTLHKLLGQYPNLAYSVD